MISKIAPRTTLHVIKSTQFKTIEINFHFIEPLNAHRLSARSLLASVLESRSADFTSQAAMAAKLAQLYGAGFSINVAKNGTYSFLTVRLVLVNPRFLPTQSSLVTDGLHFIYQVLQRPYLVNGHFDEQVVQRERTNLLAYLRAAQDDKQFYANLMAQAYYYQTTAQQTPSFGDAQVVQHLQASDLMDAYQSLFTEDQVVIEVLGDVDEQTVLQGLTPFQWGQLPLTLPTIFYHQPLQKQQTRRLYLPRVQQGKLSLVYQVPAYFYQHNYPAWLVTNALFGGTTQSLLFLHVREQQQLAYYADSTLDPFCGALLVQSGIDAHDYQQVVATIQQQVQLLRDGQITATLLQQNKQSLLNDFVMHLDTSRNLLNRALYADLLRQHLPDVSEFTILINAVTIADVQACAAQMQLQVQLCVMNEEDQ